MPRIAGVSDRDAGLGAKIAFFFTKRRLAKMTGLETATMLEPLRMYAHIPKLLNAYGRLELAESKLDILSPRHRALAELKSATTVRCEYCIDLGRRSPAAGESPTRNCSRWPTIATPPVSPTWTS
jgi:alkylhydroperoxidase family enzyme